eukprot:Gb_26078 [translate_table: standard]
MGGEPVTTEPIVLVVDEEVRNILEEAGLLAFFKKFRGHSESITNQFVNTWKDGRVVIDKIKILVNATLIAEVPGLPNDGKVISREKMNQGSDVSNEIFNFGRKVQEVVWLPYGLFEFCPIPPTSHIDSGDSISEAEGESESQEKGSPIKNPKDKGGRKRKLPAQGSVVAPSKNVKSPGDPLLLTEELICHLRVLNSLGSSLSSMYACVNLLTLEITNYLKEVLKFMKEKNVEKG